jgi:hypothetical protein
MCSHPNDNIFFHIRGPNTQENVSYILDFYVSSDVHFSRFEELKITLMKSSHFVLGFMYQRVSGVWRVVIVHLTEKKAKTSFREFHTSNMQIGNTVNHKQIYDDLSHFLVIFIEICVTV